MAGRGPAPKDPEKRKRRNKPSEGLTLPADGHDGSGAPRFPASYRLGGDLVKPLKSTREWWETWIHSPQAAEFSATDWRRLVTLVPLVDQYHRGDLKLAAELRLQEERLGGTPLDRKRLGWSIATGSAPSQRTSHHRHLRVVGVEPDAVAGA